MKISILLQTFGLAALLVGCDSGSSSGSAPAGGAAPAGGTPPANASASNGAPEKTTPPAGVSDIVPQESTEKRPVGAHVPEVPPLSGDKTGPLVGKVEGREFTPTLMRWRSSTLDLATDDQPFPEIGIRIFFRKMDRSDVPFGQAWKLKPGMRPPLGLEVQFRARHPETRKPETKVYKEGGYRLLLAFNEDTGEGPLTGYVEVVTDDPRYSVKGEFAAEFSGVRTEDHGVVDVMSTNLKTMGYIVHEKIKEKFPDKKVEWVGCDVPRVHKTMQKGFRVGCLQGDVLMDGNPTSFGATVAFNVGEGWSCAEVLEPHQIPDAFPVLEPPAPPNGNLLHFLEYLVARRIQNGISPGTKITNYKAQMLNNRTPPLNRVLATIEYMENGQAVKRRMIVRHKDPLFLIDHELLPDENYDLEKDLITKKR